jgi:translocation and assembly module TamB
VQVAGTADFEGRVVGNPSQPQVNGQASLNNFALNTIAFEPLQGSVNINPGKGLQIDLKGPQHRLALQLNARNEPLAIAVRRDELAVTGQAVGPLFNIALEQIPLDQLVGLGSNFGYDVNAASLGVAGKLSANAVLNLARMEVPQATIVLNQAQIGTFPTAFQSPQIQAQISYVNGVGKSTVRLNRPRFGTVETTDAVTNLVYANQVLRIADFTVQKKQSRLSLSGNLDLRTVPRLDGEVKVAQGKIEDILSAFQLFDFSDLGRGMNLPKYGNAAGLGNISIGMPTQSNVSLKTQLERLAEVNTQIKQLTQNRRNLVQPIRGTDQVNPILPDRLDIEGLFDSKIRFSTSPQGIAQGINLDEFELTAKRIEWRPFASYPKFEKSEGKTRLIQQKNQKLEAQSILITGSYKDGQLNLTRADAAIGEGKIEAQLNYGGEFTSGFFKLKRLPISDIRRFYPFPLALVGEINATANFGGTKMDPNAIGFIDLKEGGINGTPITSASGSFGYQKGRLKLDTSLQIDNPEPLTLTGYIPVQLPFLKLDESNNDIDLKINVRNQGLALMNLFNAPIVWQKGEGEVNLTIGGKLSQPTANGLISLKNASFLAPGLPEPLTNVNGTIRFDQDRLRVEALQGEFSQGNIAAKGSLPLFALLGAPINDELLPPTDRTSNSSCLNPEVNQPLSVEMNRIALSYKGLYRGNVRGCMNVAGNAIKPRLSGEITLSEGKVLLADEVPASDPIGTAGGESNTGLAFDNLKLTLGNGIQIVRAPILNFVAEGTLSLNGNLNAPQPEGRIVLKSGQVNLFTTQFVLIRKYAHTAIFKPGQGLDPTLDVRMITAVPEVRRSSVARSPNSINSEVDDSPLFAASVGSLQTVRIQAKVSGVASQLFENLELSSSPSRGRNEIIGLLGGGFINTLGRGDSTLGIANLAGSALLTNIQGLVGNTLGLSEFRLFPTIATDAERRSSTLGLAAEAGFDITPGLSTSVLKILTSRQSAQFGLRYRINDRLLFRGSTDFGGDNRAALEYEVRF